MTLALDATDPAEPLDPVRERGAHNSDRETSQPTLHAKAHRRPELVSGPLSPLPESGAGAAPARRCDLELSETAERFLVERRSWDVSDRSEANTVVDRKTAGAGRGSAGGAQSSSSKAAKRANSSAATSAEGAARFREPTVALVEETASVSKRQVEDGRVRVSTHTDIVEQLLSESLRSEAISVTRVACDREIPTGGVAPSVRIEDGVTIVPVLEEVLFVEKRVVLKEELHIRRTEQTDDLQIPITLRKQHASIERVSSDESPADPSKEDTQ